MQCFDTIDDINFGVVTGRDKIQENFGERNFEAKKFSPLTKFLYYSYAFKTRIINASFCLKAYLNL